MHSLHVPPRSVAALAHPLPVPQVLDDSLAALVAKLRVGDELPARAIAFAAHLCRVDTRVALARLDPWAALVDVSGAVRAAAFEALASSPAGTLIIARTHACTRARVRLCIPLCESDLLVQRREALLDSLAMLDSDTNEASGDVNVDLVRVRRVPPLCAAR